MRLKTFTAMAAVAALSVALAGGAGIAQAASAHDGATWAALGDSYTAGVFAGAKVEPQDGCLRTEDAYPYRAHAAARPDLTLVNASCSSAEIRSFWNAQQPPVSEGAPEGGWAPVAPQLDSLDGATEIVTVGVGGNTFGFGAIMTRCLLLGAIGGSERPDAPCAASYQADLASGSLGSLEPTMQTTLAQYRVLLDDIKSKAPNAKVYTIGYPQLTPADPQTCQWGDQQQFSTISRGDIPLFRIAQERLNEGMATASRDAGVEFVDLYQVSAGKDVCSPKAERWIEGIFLDPAGTRLAAIHPNSTGHAAEARVVAQAVK
jgi:hypothetical protein